MLNLTTNFFAKPFSEQIELFILPALKESNFPFREFCDVLSKNMQNVNDHASAPWLLNAFLKLGTGTSRYSRLLSFLRVVEELTKSLLDIQGVHGNMEDEDDSDDEDDGGDQEMEDVSDDTKRVAKQGLDLLNDPALVRQMVDCVDAPTSGEALPALKSLCRTCHHLLVLHPLALHHFRLLYTLAFRPTFLHNLWNLVLETKRPSLVGNTSIPLITVISRGSRTSPQERDDIVPLLAVFAALFGYLLVTIHDTEFYGESQLRGGGPVHDKHRVWMPFSLRELVPMSLALRDVTIGLVELAFPETRPTVREDYQNVVKSFRGKEDAAEMPNEACDVQVWSHLFRTTVALVRQLYTRDTRRQFCPSNHWISDRIALPLDRANDVSLRRSRLRHYRPFQGLRCFTREELVEEGPPLSAKEVRLATVLRELPYAISFEQRVHVFHSLVAKDKDEHQGDIVNFGQGKQIRAHIRRNFIYEDAFEKLSEENGIRFIFQSIRSFAEFNNYIELHFFVVFFRTELKA